MAELGSIRIDYDEIGEICSLRIVGGEVFLENFVDLQDALHFPNVELIGNRVV